MNIQEQVVNLVEEKIASTGNFLVEVKVNPGKIAVIIDHPAGVKIEDCVAINRFLHERLDETDVFERYELEVGSPGMEEPLKILPQYKKRIGREVSVLTFDGLKRKGKLTAADETHIELSEEVITKDGKKKVTTTKQISIPFTDIKETRVIFSFDKII
jgi:ribosome maturation factor RimP